MEMEGDDFEIPKRRKRGFKQQYIKGFQREKNMIEVVLFDLDTVGFDSNCNVENMMEDIKNKLVLASLNHGPYTVKSNEAFHLEEDFEQECNTSKALEEFCKKNVNVHRYSRRNLYCPRCKLLQPKPEGGKKPLLELELLEKIGLTVVDMEDGRMTKSSIVIVSNDPFFQDFAEEIRARKQINVYCFIPVGMYGKPFLR